jgi:hypothetical protein
MTGSAVRVGITMVALVLAVGAAGASARPRLAYSAADPVLRAIHDVRSSGRITASQATSYRRTYVNTRHEIARLSGVRAQELASALGIVRGIAARGSLTASRMPFVFLTLHRNLGWWSSRGRPAPGSGGEPGAKGRHCKPLASLDVRAASVKFPGSGILFEYYPGLGLQLQVNGTFSSIDSKLKYGSLAAATAAGATLDEMLPLASRRHGLLTWEYEFPFEGAEPPWTSGLSQATAIEALVRAAARLNRPDFLKVALRLARLFAVAPRVGVRVRLSAGDWFLLYSFDSSQLVLNADLDALIALHDLRVATGSQFVAGLLRSGLRALEHYLPRFDTGKWSYYALGGPLADLNYHVLNLELARDLCQRTGIRAVCRAARSFARELNARCPVVNQSGDQQTLDQLRFFGLPARPA